MLGLINKGIKSIFGSKSDKDIKEVKPVVAEINEVYETMMGLSPQQLRDETEKLRAEIKEGLKEVQAEIQAERDFLNDNPSIDFQEKEARFETIDKLTKKEDEELELILEEILPRAFAIVKQTARMFMENERVEVTATPLDEIHAGKFDHLEISAGKSIWYNEWAAAGVMNTWNMLHYDVQMIGGIVLHRGRVAEMATGEGKTLVATLPAFLNGLSGKGVHIVTVNDYLARRDQEWMAPIFRFHGLTCDCIDKYEPHTEERKRAYQSDIAYGTNNEFGFDYLRDNMARETEELVQQKHHYVMIDEVDSVLIDDARTPLIISGPVPRGDIHEYQDLKPRISKLVEAQQKLVSAFLIEAKKEIKDGDMDAGGVALFRAFRGLPKYKPLIKYLSESGIRQLLNKTEAMFMNENSKRMPEADAPLLFSIEEKNNSVDLTDNGINLITSMGTDEHFFIMPDISTAIDELEQQALEENDFLAQKDAIIQDYSVKAARIHSVNQLLKAYTLFERDTEYILDDGKIKIVDENTGRVMDGRRYSDGLHQALEAKENVKVEDATQTYATVTLQNYFRMYHKMAGMTGTAETEAGEFWEIYKLDVTVIPTNREIVREDRQDKIYKTMREKFNAVAEEIVEMTQEKRPVLVGTTSVEISELLSRMLKIRNIDHQVLNAKQHQREADVVANAGKPGAVTIATNMAGRGTDIKLTQESKDAGGLAIIGTERHDSRRVDRQLRGRSGRQGDPGSSQFFVSMEDNLMRMFMSERVAKLMDKYGLKEGEVIQAGMVTSSLERAQKKVEENHFGTRKRLLEYDDVMNSQREVIYRRRRNALHGERLELDILTMLYDTAEEMVINAKAADSFDSLKLNCLNILGLDTAISSEEFNSQENIQIAERLYEEALKHYLAKNEYLREKAHPTFQQIQANRGGTVKNIVVPFTDGKRQTGVVTSLIDNVESGCREMINNMERILTLQIIDLNWKEHLRDMDDLKQAVQGAVHEQKDPLLIYKFEAFEMFKGFINKVNEDTIAYLMKATIHEQEPEKVQEARASKPSKPRYNENKEEATQLAGGGVSAQAPRQAVEPTAPRRVAQKFGRNDRISVRYEDGTVKENVKFKTVEDDISKQLCAIINA